jgi:glycosyltransferase involved in cell wall biosynthesis
MSQRMNEDKTGTILFISHDASRTGAPLFLLRFLQWFRQHSALPFRVLVGDTGELVSDFEALAPVDSFEPAPTFAYRGLRRLGLNDGAHSRHLSLLRERLAQTDIRLIYSNTEVTGKILDFLSFLDCPVICHVHGLESTIRHFGAENMASIQKYSSSYIAVSQAVKDNLAKNHAIPAEKIRMIYGFIPVESNELQAPAKSRSQVFRELGMPEAAKMVCACGSIEHRKGTDLFLEVADEVARHKDIGPVHFVWVGGNAKAGDEMKRRFNSPDTVHFIGPTVDVRPYYAAADVFLLSSREDAFPLVVMEAGLMGKPVVCFGESGGAPEFVEADAGFVIPGFDVKEMANKIVTLLSSEKLRMKMGEAARQKVLRRHRLDKGASDIAQIIEQAFQTSTSLPNHGDAALATPILASSTRHSSVE